MTSCSLQKCLDDLGVNVILITTLAKHCSYIYNLDSYYFKIEFSKGGAKHYEGGAFAPPPLKRNPVYSIASSSVHYMQYMACSTTATHTHTGLAQVHPTILLNS